MFESDLCYACLVWTEKTKLVKILYLLQKNSLRIMFFQGRNSNIDKIDKTALEHLILISTFSKGVLSSAFHFWLKYSHESFSYDTRWTNLGYLKIASYWTKCYDRYSVTVNVIYI